jgi:hypothetical protein
MQLRRRWCALTLLLALGLLGAYSFGICWRNGLAEAHQAQARGRLGYIRAVLDNYEVIHGHPLPRTSGDDQGRIISWREALLSFVDQTRDVPGEENSPICFRLPFEQSDPRFTSLVAVYDADKANDESAPWAIVAIENTGIRWNEPKDFTFEQFEYQASLADAAKRPIAVLTTAGDNCDLVKGRLQVYHQPRKRELLHLQMFRRPDRGDESENSQSKDD